MDAMRIGLVGCGGHGYNLAQAVARVGSLELVACADVDEPAARRAAEVGKRAGVYSSVAELLASCDVDAVLIATPHHVLAPTALAAMRGGKHVLVEKPMAMNAREGIELASAANASDLVCMPGYSFRFSMGKSLQAALREGSVGEITTIIGSFGVAPMNSGWRSSADSGGGPLLYVGCHLIDLVLWLTDVGVTDVLADVRWRSDTGTDESSVIQLRLAGGGRAVLLVTQAAPAVSYELQVHGRSGAIALRGRSLAHFELELFSTSVPAYREPSLIRPTVWRDHISSMLVPELEEFAAAIRGQRRPAITEADGVEVLRVLDAVAQSASSGQRVTLGAPSLAAR